MYYLPTTPCCGGRADVCIQYWISFLIKAFPVTLHLLWPSGGDVLVSIFETVAQVMNTSAIWLLVIGSPHRSTTLGIFQTFGLTTQLKLIWSSERQARAIKGFGCAEAAAVAAFPILPS